FIFKDQKLIAHVIKAFGWKILGKPSMRSLEIAVEYNCNSKCEQCSCRLAYDPSRPRLTVDEFKNAIDQAIALGAFQFNITGGEPLLQFEDVKEILKYIKSKKGYSHICSNGLIMTEEKLDALVKAGLNSIEMGLDSAVPAIHDGNRRENGFEKIMQVIEWAKEKKLTIILNTISTHEKIENGDLLALYKLAKQKGVYVQVTPPCVTGAWKNKTEILLDKDETDYFWWLMTFPRMRTDMYSSFTSVRCPAVREKIGIQPYGDVVSCPLVQIVYGNIKQESLKSIRDKMLQNPYYLRVSTCLPAFDREFIDKYLIEK
ncbi:radical SAM protein, partial [Patescibacteria group bacterium]|nr:radical SAM protein [Patescibacteria group bacterium]